MCKRFGLWEKLAKARELNALSDPESGFSPDTLAAQLIFLFTSGRTSLQQFDHVQHDAVMLESVGLAKAADTKTVVRWLESQTPASVAELRAINAGLVQDVLKKAPPARVRGNDSTMRVVYEDCQLRVETQEFESARLDDDGFLVLTKYVLWAGPFPLELGIDGPEALFGDKLDLLHRYRHLWNDTACHFFSDTDGCTGEQMTEVRKGGFTQWSVRNLAWREQLWKIAAGLPEAAWFGNVRRLHGITENYARIYHTLEGTSLPQAFAVARWRGSQVDAPWQYVFLACEPGSAREPEDIFAYHRMRGKGEEEDHAIPFFTELGLRHPPCRSLIANQAFYALATIAWNILMALRVLEMPDRAQGWWVETIVHNLLHVPATQAKHANQTLLQLVLPAFREHRTWWETAIKKLVSKRKRGESLVEPWTRRKRP
jgi:hypothetical protein